MTDSNEFILPFTEIRATSSASGIFFGLSFSGVFFLCVIDFPFV